VELETLRRREGARQQGGTLPIAADRPRLAGPVEGADIAQAMAEVGECTRRKGYQSYFWHNETEDITQASVTVIIPEVAGQLPYLEHLYVVLDDLYDCTIRNITIIPGTNTQFAIEPRFEQGSGAAFGDQYREQGRRGTRARRPGARELKNTQRRLHLLPNGTIGVEHRIEGLIVPLEEFFADMKIALRRLVDNGRVVTDVRLHLIRYRSTLRRPNVPDNEPPTTPSPTPPAGMRPASLVKPGRGRRGR
jgi:hypothetical protein